MTKIIERSLQDALTIELRATAVLQTIVFGERVVTGRFEIRWSVMEPFISLNIHHYNYEEWFFICSLIMLGCRKAGVIFTYQDLLVAETVIKREVQGCENIGV